MDRVVAHPAVTRSLISGPQFTVVLEYPCLAKPATPGSKHCLNGLLVTHATPRGERDDASTFHNESQLTVVISRSDECARGLNLIEFVAKLFGVVVGYVSRNL